MSNTMNFRKKLMFKIYRVWFVRRVLPVVVFEVFSVMLGAHLFSRSVYVVRVLEGAAAASTESRFRLFDYLWYALVHSRVEVKVEIAIALIFAGLFLWSIKRAIVSYEVLRRTVAAPQGETNPPTP
ncbi:MAG: hypothetical protein Q7R85_04675 [bacterium]|nr:hypothetical protein [bacterium]